MMSAPLILVTMPIILGLILKALGRRPRLMVVGGVFSLFFLGLAVANVPISTSSDQVDGGLLSGNIWNIFGTTLVLTRQIQATFLFVFVITAVLFLLTLLIHQGNDYIPLSLVLLSPMATVLMVQPFPLGAVSLLIVIAMLAVMVQGGRSDSTLAAFRLLTMAALAVPLVLSAGWMLNSGQLSSVSTIARLLLVAFIILLAGFPFHIWVGPIVAESKSLVPTVVFGLVQVVITIFCYKLILENPAVGLNAQFLQLLRASAIGTFVLGGILALTAPSFGRLLGYVLLIDISGIIFAFSIGGATGLESALSMVLMRIFSLLISGFGLGLLRRQISTTKRGVDHVSAVSGLVHQSPLGLVLFVYGCLSLIGLPLTPGFSSRWVILVLAGEQSTSLTTFWILSITAATVGVIRFLNASINQMEDTGDNSLPNPKAARIVAGLLLGLGIVLALFPQLLLSFARSLAQLS